MCGDLHRSPSCEKGLLWPGPRLPFLGLAVLGGTTGLMCLLPDCT